MFRSKMIAAKNEAYEILTKTKEKLQNKYFQNQAHGLPCNSVVLSDP